MRFVNRALSFAAVAAVAASSVHAQEVKKDGLWRGTAGASLAATSGNSDTQSMNASVDMFSITASDKISTGGGINYGKSKDSAGKTTTTANRWNGYGQYDYNLSPKIFVFGRLGLEGDKLVDLSMRTTVSGGVGYKVIESKDLTFNLFGGAGYSTDKYSKKQTIGGKTDTKFSRASLMFGEESSHVLSASTTFKQRLEVYPGLSGDKAKILKFTAGLGVAMSSTMNLTVGLTDNYNSAPPAGKKKNDLGLFTGINVKLGSN
jgi:putative salt-induced outer membrane protein